MADELPEKVREAIEKGPICVAIGEQALGVETYAMFARRIARLAIEESTRSLREKLENAEEGYARRHKDATDLWEKINFPGGLNAQILELRERLERAQAAASGPMKDSTGTWTEWIRFDSDCIVNGVEVKAGTSWGPFEKSRNIRRSDALAIREAKEGRNVL